MDVAEARLAEGLEPPRGSAKARRCAGPEGGLLADRYRLGDELGRGSMRPKVEAAVRFLKGGGRRALIAQLDQGLAALRGEAGTEIRTR